MTDAAQRLPGVLTGLAVLAAGAAMTLDGTGMLEFGFGWWAASATLVSGLGLLTVAPASPAMYAGVLSRELRGGRLWTCRATTVALAPIAGVGPAAYALLSLVQAVRGGARTPSPDWRRRLGTGAVGLSVVVAGAELGLQVGSDALLWSVLLVASSLSVYWWSAGLGATRTQIAVLLGLGALLIGPVLVPTVGSGGVDRTIAVAGAALAVMLIFAPRWLRTSRELAVERVERARADERAEVAGAVHDSVLQTLALIQTRADDPAEVKALARRQERDLRARLFGAPDPAAPASSIATALRAVAAEVEDTARVKIDVVTLGDAPLDEAATALVAAAREALLNAAKHAPEAPISLFCEVDEWRVSTFVRDRGPGFDLRAIPEDRRGVRDSIVARMVRHGGRASVRTAPGGGCEVRLMLERRR